ncbi:MAG: hypothetical protein AAGD96_11705 [Chloroflexota bacterium]
MNRFPNLETKDLNGKAVRLPSDFSTEYTLLFIAYLQWQQREVDSWIPFAEELEATVPNLRYYELPVVGEMGFFGRKQLDFWMRTGIHDIETRSRTLTLYIDRANFCRQLGIETEDNIAILLLDKNHKTVWKEYGAFDISYAKSIRKLLVEHGAIQLK